MTTRRQDDAAELQPFAGIGDPRYLLAEILELREIAEAAGFGTLPYLLECAAMEARKLALAGQAPVRDEARGS
jgi:hypothetical protein